MSAPVFLADRDALGGAAIRLDGPEGHHAATVLRVRVGERIELTDGRGLRVRAVVSEVAPGRVAAEVVERTDVPPPQPRLVVVQAVPKGDRGERAVELMTEVGVDEVVPWRADRCVAAWRGERAARGARRWRSTATAAAKQARRWWHPVVGDLAATNDVVERIQAAALGVVLHKLARQPLATLDLPVMGEVVVVVGPEGGLTDDELARFVAAGAVAARMGPTVLRTSTAGAAAGAVLLSRTARWVSGR